MYQHEDVAYVAGLLGHTLGRNALTWVVDRCVDADDYDEKEAAAAHRDGAYDRGRGVTLHTVIHALDDDGRGEAYWTALSLDVANLLRD